MRIARFAGQVGYPENMVAALVQANDVFHSKFMPDIGRLGERRIIYTACAKIHECFICIILNAVA